MSHDFILLASGSPRRKQLFEQFLIPHQSVPARKKEPNRFSDETPSEFACRAALWKAHDVSLRYPDHSILGADTIVSIDDLILGKPSSCEEAAQMLQLLSGREHTVITGLALLNASRDPVIRFAETIVVFRNLLPAEIEWYSTCGDGLDKAGGYGIQSWGGAFVREIHGDWYNVVGLPIPLLIDMFTEFAPNFWPPQTN